jgi:hypothetical protein
MTLNFPNRTAWFFIGLLILILWSSGCQPIQPLIQPPDDAPAAVQANEAGRANLSTNIANQHLSPDGEWIATTLFQVPRGSSEYYQVLVVSHVSGAPSYTLVEGWYTLLPGYKVAEPLTWSADGQRFYYTNRHNPDGCGLLYNGSDLHVVDLASGATTELLPADTTIKLGLAPEENHVAYQAMGAATITIQELETGKSSSLDLTDMLGTGQMGAFVWSPDSSAIAFVVAHNPCSGGWAESTSIYVLDAQTLELTLHLQHDDRLLMPAAWPDAQALILENQEGEKFIFDLESNTVQE